MKRIPFATKSPRPKTAACAAAGVLEEQPRPAARKMTRGQQANVPLAGNNPRLIGQDGSGDPAARSSMGRVITTAVNRVNGNTHHHTCPPTSALRVPGACSHSAPRTCDHESDPARAHQTQTRTIIQISPTFEADQQARGMVLPSDPPPSQGAIPS